MQCLPILFYQYSIRAHARVHVYMLYLFVKSVSCFIFMFQLIENQTFQEMKHGTKKRLKVNIMYARVRQRVLTWGRRVLASAFACQGSMP